MNILITGGTSGLGKATTILLAKDANHRIIITYCNNKSAANELMCIYPNVSAYRVDFSDAKQVDWFCETIKNLDIDVLVNNAYSGSPMTTHFHKIKTEVFLDSFQNNLIPTIKITQACIEGMRKKKFGKIINIITSYVMNLPPIGFSTYVGNKAYLEKISDVINKEYTKYNITSNCILPDFMNTGFGDVDERIIEQVEAGHPLKKLLLPEETALAVKFFVEAPQQVNGVKMPVNAAQCVKN